MRDITFPVRSHVEVTETTFGSTALTFGDLTIRRRTTWRFAPASSTAIRRSPGHEVRSFRELVRIVAELSAANPRLFPLYRGQNQDYRNAAGASMLYPSLFRRPAGKHRVTRRVIEARQRYLREVIAQLRANPPLARWQIPLASHTEVWWALLQHYELAATPLLDLTQSLRVAATFALTEPQLWQGRQEGYVFVFGLPNAPACLAPMVDEEMVLVRLQSVCPPNAFRPHFQEGYMVGRWPLSREKLKGDNAAYRLLGKYRLDNYSGSFWDPDFAPLPRAAIYPSDDAFGDRLKQALGPLVGKRPQ